ncbi:uncharacterized protein LOC130628576 isoform X2 [Hydractinia symbiolongicarpus]|nr:uncharacterized protein LOC130628576 isoform X2 [Hydractinia symbiolongicarpus]XP_057297516.1 uncharacterized protein LOC130628576 isoform X2 [Hydractinia symbiolongicarpus]XP_057297517.1 uncharacterized protein LOC130628576 isoform X2 [Hydractinia symbiolongicarpus]XP_057297518.1 uncharacterized protein LOC130628576 isoform X2 [Hydractinia symbiolongicarpus]
MTKANLLLRHNSFKDYQSKECDEDNFYQLTDSNSNEYMFTNTESKHQVKLAKTRKVNGFKTNNDKDEISRPLTRKKSFARLGNALRDFQQKLSMRTNNKPDEKVDVNIEKMHKKCKRSLSLPAIVNEEKTSKKRTRKLSVFRKSPAPPKTPDTECNNNNDAIFTRMKNYRHKNPDQITEEERELELINKRRRGGRSRSAQLPRQEGIIIKEKLSRNRSLSADFEEVPTFQQLVALRLHSSKETQLCSTDL